MTTRRPIATWMLLVALAGTTPLAARAHEGHVEPGAGTATLARSEHPYRLPALKVSRADGKRMTLAEAIDDGRPVMLNFIYTTCTAVCPVTSQVFVEFRQKIGAEKDRINMVSISIDAEQDTPAALTAYARQYSSAGAWPHYTGASADMVEIQRAFDAWRGDKMNHLPTTYLRAAPGKPWVRLDGFYTPTALLAEYQKLVPPAPRSVAAATP